MDAKIKKKKLKYNFQCTISKMDLFVWTEK